MENVGHGTHLRGALPPEDESAHVAMKESEKNEKFFCEKQSKQVIPK